MDKTNGTVASPDRVIFEQMARPIKDLTGKTFGILKVERFAFLKGHHAYWRSRCECGTEKDIRQDTLLAGVTVSCSCRKISILKQRPQAHAVQDCESGVSGEMGKEVATRLNS